MEEDEEADHTSDIYPYRMAAHARLKNTEDEKYHNLMSKAGGGKQFIASLRICE